MPYKRCRLFAPSAALLVLSAACNLSDDNQAEGRSKLSMDSRVGIAAGAASKPANTAGTAGADDRPVRIKTDSDQLFLEMAERACDASDFSSFLRAFSGSWLVRERYTAPRVNFGSIGTSRAMLMRQYLDQNNFPFTPMDTSYATSESVRLFESAPDPDWRKLVFVEVDINTAGDNRQRVDWVSGVFERNLDPPPSHLEEGLGELVQPISSGYVLFEPTESCWQLTQDVSNPPEQN